MCKDVVFNFSNKERALFKALTATFTTTPYPNQDCEFHLKTDVSEFVIGRVISIKCKDGKFRFIMYMSHLITSPERNYPIHDKEMPMVIKNKNKI